MKKVEIRKSLNISLDLLEMENMNLYEKIIISYIYSFEKDSAIFLDQSELAKMLSCSSTAIRNALIHLNSLGYITYYRRAGKKYNLIDKTKLGFQLPIIYRMLNYSNKSVYKVGDSYVKAYTIEKKDKIPPSWYNEYLEERAGKKINYPQGTKEEQRELKDLVNNLFK